MDFHSSAEMTAKAVFRCHVFFLLLYTLCPDEYETYSCQAPPHLVYCRPHHTDPGNHSHLPIFVVIKGSVYFFHIEVGYWDITMALFIISREHCTGKV
jgi:hypothetical protein